jgi:copper(I)-binding protein
MNMLKNALVGALFAVTALAAHAQGATQKSLTIEQPFARATAPAAKVAGAFMTIKNGGATPDRLLGAASPVAGVVELHEMTMDGNVMKMRAVPGIDVAAGGKAELKPGGYHVMLRDLKAPLVEGQSFPLTLRFEKAGTVEVKVQVEARGATVPHKH